jgi:hypothetical protein
MKTIFSFIVECGARNAGNGKKTDRLSVQQVHAALSIVAASRRYSPPSLAAAFLGFSEGMKKAPGVALCRRASYCSSL